ncbi:MAG: glycoside hydrolase family 2 TIM barrel-domain containing protein [Bacteroidota bacterium]|nr:glycoside hydrolase family 2 TIM barrel-domain containing protein [Bacteroidota bacterium]
MKNDLKKAILFFTLFAGSLSLFAQWKPTGDRIKTSWAEKIDTNNILPEYPRPIMERSDWKNLNGLWEYAITQTGNKEPATFDGKILVPFPVESSLSGVQKRLTKDNVLWYKRSFTIPSNWKNKTILLHFGAVDWKTEVFLNDILIGAHTGGYTPFTLDITPYLTAGKQQLVVKVWDPTTDGYQPAGKQSLHPEGIVYTPVSGIWQTVWLEPVSRTYISKLTAIPDIDARELSLNVATENTTKADILQVTLFDGTKVVVTGKFAAGTPISLSIPEPKLWSPESPFLYTMNVELYVNGKLSDNVTSYAAMRKISAKRDSAGIMRLQLNNKDYFQFGPLDQGWWPDGLYTAPTDEALAYDIQKTKELGFNMIRKHAKVEPARWYTHCDQLGILVWQDMPSGDHSPQWQGRQYFDGKELERSYESESNYRKEWNEIMDYLVSNPCVVIWTPFNEAWGQFKTQEIVEWTKRHDPSRMVNPASGGNFYHHVGDILDLHNYPAPEMHLYDPERVNVLGEFGGIGFAVKGHLWQADQNFSYIQFKSGKEVTDEYINYVQILKDFIKKGFSAAVYTQTTDVEGEVNGLMTYDRKVLKIDEQRVKALNEEICRALGN